ncbi:hypothetical protein [Bacteroides acidifaciens]|jgi:hypothetical protein|uniref:hypothetical protein n=1 Tax=Bacteroides acidifaciens TaxID=85831 RepID=UPI00158E4869|nr:hypothetical protein [Bacteroides acidifaciens]MDE6821133.1 hypothetical protein [Bacteroides acidifaciens]MDE6987714.1 hypothetical protein [Bacteroides acidifaciens]
MKSNKEIVSFISTGIIKRFCCFTFFIMLLMHTYAQKSEISIGLEILTVVQSDFRPLALHKVKGDTIPVRVSFEFFVMNHTDKPLLFGSNTRHYYKRNWDNSSYGEIGRFLMINGTDSIALYTDYGSLVLSTPKDTVAYWASIESVEDSKIHPVFVPFLRHWGNSGKDWIGKLYNYFKDSRFVYIPILSDYRRRLGEFEDKSIIESIVYPREVIEIKKREPFFICISDFEGNYYFYPK